MKRTNRYFFNTLQFNLRAYRVVSIMSPSTSSNVDCDHDSDTTIPEFCGRISPTDQSQSQVYVAFMNNEKYILCGYLFLDMPAPAAELSVRNVSNPFCGDITVSIDSK